MIKVMNSSSYGSYRNRTFSDIWGDVDSFITDYHECDIEELVGDAAMKTLYYLLYARYGNSTIASFDENQFKYKLFAIVFQYGPTWEAKLQLQKDLRGLSGDALAEGNTRIYNQAQNPATDPTTNTLNELEYINSQNTSKTRRSKLDQIMLKNEMLEKDVSGEFLSKFSSLFLKVVAPQLPLWYVDGNDENEDEVILWI